MRWVPSYDGRTVNVQHSGNWHTCWFKYDNIDFMSASDSWRAHRVCGLHLPALIDLATCLIYQQCSMALC